MEKLYFDTIDKLLAFKSTKLSYILAFYYFPVLFLTAMVCFTLMSSYVLFLLSMLFFLFAPMLMKPAYYGMKGQNYLLFRKFSAYLDSTVPIQNLFNSKPLEISFFSKSNKQEIFVLESLEKLQEDEEVIYSPNKTLSKSTIRKLKQFYVTSANEYFDVVDFPCSKFLGLIDGKKNVRITDLIAINNELKLQSVALFNSLHSITKIHKIQLVKLFTKFNRKTKKHTRIGIKVLYSATSQYVE